MRYDLNALFYEKKSDTKPRYNVPMGLVFPDSFDYFPNKGFIEDPDSTPGYLDYIKQNVTEDDLQDLTGEHYSDEMMEVLSCGEDFGKIEIRAMELDVIDDKGTVPPRGFMQNGIFVKLEETDYGSPVFFIDGDPYLMTDSTRVVEIHLGALKHYFGVKTQNEVAGKIRRMRKDRWHNFDELEKWIEKVLDAEPKEVTIYYDPYDNAYIKVTVSIEDRNLFRVTEYDLRSYDPDDDYYDFASLEKVKSVLGLKRNFEVLRWFAENFSGKDSFKEINDWMDRNSVRKN